MAGGWAVCFGEEVGVVRLMNDSSFVCLSVCLFVCLFVCFVYQMESGLGMPTQVWGWSSTCAIR